MDTTFIFIGFFLALIGFIGCILPALPGPPISFLSLIILCWAKNWSIFSTFFLLTTGFLMVLITVADYVVPAVSGRKYGASRSGLWGSIIGMLLGIAFFPPWGLLIGAIAGVLAGEFLAGKKGRDALRASWGILIGNMTVTLLKLVFSLLILILYVANMF